MTTANKKITFVFYTETAPESSGRQFVYFKDTENGLITGEIAETDCNAATLAGARILLTQIHSELKEEMLIGDKQIEFYTSEQQLLQQNLSDDWSALWKHVDYYEIQEFLCEQDVYNTDDCSFYTYFIKITEVGLNNLSILRDVKLVSSEQLTPNFISAGFAESSSFSDLNTIINSIQEFNNSEGNRNNTFIQFINKPQGWDRFQRGRSFVPVNAIYKGVFKRKFEHWYTFNVAKGEYPEDSLLNQARSIIVPGSGAGAWEDIEWVKNLSVFLKRVYTQFPHLRFIGICFGFQIIAQTFGGIVKQTEGRKQDPHFHVIGNEEIRINNKFTNEQFFKDTFNDETMTSIFINKGHGDYVESLPEEFFDTIGESNTAPNEIALSKDKRMLLFQGHPEYAFEYSRRLMATFSTCSDKTHTHDWNWHLESDKFKELFSKPNYHTDLIKMINTFIRNY